MKEYKYKGFAQPIIVDDNGIITYQGREIEKYYHGYMAVGCASGFSYRDSMKAYYIEEMMKIDNQIEQEQYRSEHKAEFDTLPTADECIEYFFSLLN